MLRFDVAPNASLAEHNNSDRLREDARIWFAARGIELTALNMLNDGTAWRFAFAETERGEQNVTLALCQEFMAQHNNAPLTEAQIREAEAEAGKADLLSMIDIAISDYTVALNNWDALTQAQLRAVIKRNTQVLQALLKHLKREIR